MPEYEVTVRMAFEETYVVEAEDEDEARRNGIEAFCGDPDLSSPEDYSEVIEVRKTAD